MIEKTLQKRRQELNLTQQEVADHLHVTRQTISNWETGKNYPDIPTLVKISDYYDLSLDYLLKGDQQMLKQLKKEANLVQLVQAGIFLLVIVLPIDFCAVLLLVGALTTASMVDLKMFLPTN